VSKLKEKLIVVSFQFDKVFVKDYLFIGLFSGAQILLDNMIYSAIVCKMVNAVSEQGNYWVANNYMGVDAYPNSSIGGNYKEGLQR
jgi:hypothetical protein